MTHFLTDRMKRSLCVSCHASIVTRSTRNPDACTCTEIDKCKTCRDREYMYIYRQKNRERLADYWMAYYYDNYEKMRPQKLRHKHASLQRLKAKQTEKAALD